MMLLKSSVPRKLVKSAFIVLIVLFFVFYLRNIDYAVFSTIEWHWTPLLMASAISLAFRYWGILIWRVVLVSLGATVLPSFPTLAVIYGRAWMARYIPGTFAWVGGKIWMAHQHGISKSRLAASSLLEAGTQIVATMVVALAILSLDSRTDVFTWQTRLMMVLIALAMALLLYPRCFNAVMHRVCRLKGTETFFELEVNGRAVLRSFALYVMGALIAGSGYYFLAISLSSDITPDMYWFIVGALSLAGALGMAAIFVPSGLGVREGVQLVLLSLIVPREIALVITVASRLWSAAVDVIFYVSTEILGRLVAKK